MCEGTSADGIAGAPKNESEFEVMDMSSIIQVPSVNYPESDGKPMAETDLHRKEMVRQIDLLERFFQGQRVYVSGNLLLYYERGEPKKSVAPDVFVVKDLPPGDRRVYKLWVERKSPNVVIEVTSRKTKKKEEESGTGSLIFRRFLPGEFFGAGVAREGWIPAPIDSRFSPPMAGCRRAARAGCSVGWPRSPPRAAADSPALSSSEVAAAASY